MSTDLNVRAWPSVPSPSSASARSSRRNHGSIAVRSFTSSTERSRRNASSIRSKRSDAGASSRSSSSSREAGGSAGESSSRERIALANDSRNVLPIDITSPTDFMCVVSSPCAPGNFSKANRGIFVTT